MAKSENDKRINSDLQNTTQNNGNAKRGVSPCQCDYNINIITSNNTTRQCDMKLFIGLSSVSN
jgi:hypothetical protein